MRFIILLIIIVATAWYNISYLLEEKPAWFLKAMTYTPFTNTKVEIDFNERISTHTESDIQNRFNHLLLRCRPEQSDLGDRLCMAYITEFNSIKASDIEFFFNNDRLSSLRVAFPLEQHEALINYLNSISSRHSIVADSVRRQGQELGMWVVKSGVLAAFEERPKTDDEEILNWNSFNKLTSGRLEY